MKSLTLTFATLMMICFGFQSLSAQVPQQELQPVDPAKGDRFGTTVATDGNFVVATSQATRKVHVFERDQNYWLHLTSLNGINEAVDVSSSKGFGKSVAIQGNRIAVGVPESPLAGDKNIGLIETFTLQEGKWAFESAVRPPTAETGACFGKSLDLVQNTMLVGAPDYNYEQGQAFVYEHNGTEWTATALAADVKPMSEFGVSVSLMGSQWAMVGAPGVEHRRKEIGSLFIYQKEAPNQWTLSQTIQGGNSIENLGRSIASSGQLLAVGAYDAVVLYTFNGTEWVQNEVIKNPDAGDSFSFAATLDFSPDGQHLLVGASNQVYLFQKEGKDWILLTRVANDAPMFGSSSAIGSDFFLVNSPYAGEDMMDAILYLHPLEEYMNQILK